MRMMKGLFFLCKDMEKSSKFKAESRKYMKKSDIHRFFGV